MAARCSLQDDRGVSSHSTSGQGSDSGQVLLTGMPLGALQSEADAEYAYSQEPVHRDDECDVVSGQAHRGQHDDHGDQARLRNPSCPYACSRSCDAVEINTKTENIFTNLTPWRTPCKTYLVTMPDLSGYQKRTCFRKTEVSFKENCDTNIMLIFITYLACYLVC